MDPFLTIGWFPLGGRCEGCKLCPMNAFVVLWRGGFCNRMRRGWLWEGASRGIEGGRSGGWGVETMWGGRGAGARLRGGGGGGIDSLVNTFIGDYIVKGTPWIWGWGGLNCLLFMVSWGGAVFLSKLCESLSPPLRDPLLEFWKDDCVGNIKGVSGE